MFTPHEPMENMKYAQSIYCLFLLISFAEIFVIGWDCPLKCSCNATVIECVDQEFQTPDLVLFNMIPQSVERVTVIGNNFTKLPQFMFGNCTDHPFQLSLNYLDLSRNEIKDVHEKTFHCLPNLKTLVLTDNAWYITTNTNGFFSTLSLKHLDMDGAFEQRNTGVNVSYKYHVTNLVTVFNNSELDLEYLNIASNNILRLPDSTTDMLCSFSNLKELNMSNNYLGRMFIQKCLNNLEVLDISSNYFALINKSDRELLESFPNLTSLLMANNPFACDCHMIAFHHWFQNTHVAFTDKDQLRCSNNRTMMSMTSNDLVCEDPDRDTRSRLRTSYIVLGCVFAIIGIIFCIVMFLNRATIKRKMKNFVEPCCQFSKYGSHQSYSTVNV